MEASSDVLNVLPAISKFYFATTFEILDVEKTSLKKSRIIMLYLSDNGLFDNGLLTLHGKYHSI